MNFEPGWKCKRCGGIGTSMKDWQYFYVHKCIICDSRLQCCPHCGYIPGDSEENFVEVGVTEIKTGVWWKPWTWFRTEMVTRKMIERKEISENLKSRLK